MLEKLALTYYTPRNDVGCGAVCVCVLYWNVVFHLSVCLRLSPSVSVCPVGFVRTTPPNALD